MDIHDSLREQLSKICKPHTLIVGIGNTLKGDDGAGALICQRLKDIDPEQVIDAGTVPENYIQPIIKKAPKVLLIIDAIDFGASAGAINIFRPDQLSSLAVSTHTLSPRLFVDVICKSISPEVYFIGIQPGQTVLGRPLTPEVEQAVKSLTEILRTILK
jgi:hydrogenase 3 maturation protease